MITHYNRVLHGHDHVDHFSLVRYAHENLFSPTHNHYRKKYDWHTLKRAPKLYH